MMRKLLLLLTLLTLSFIAAPAHATDIYISQSGTGTMTGVGSCSNARPYSMPESTSPGNTLHLCSTWTFGINAHGFEMISSGTNGNPITIKFGGAVLQSPAFYTGGGGIEIGNDDWVVVDGEGTGIIQNTDNGYGLGNLQDSHGIYANPCNHCEIKNFTISNICIETQNAPTQECPTAGIDIRGINTSVHDGTIHDASVLLFAGQGSADDLRLDVYNMDLYHGGWALGCAQGTASVGLFFHDNHVHDNANWDTVDGSFHKNGIHCYVPIGSGGSGYAAIYDYNNLYDGDWGDGHITAMVFQDLETEPHYLWNNVFAPSNVPFIGQSTILEIEGPIFAFNNTKTGAQWGVCFGFGGSNSQIENNVIEGCGQIFSASSASGADTAHIDYNFYGNSDTGNPLWRIIGIGSSSSGISNPTTLASWQLVCSCDAHSTAQATNFALLDPTTGIPTTGFAGETVVLNLSASATGNLATLQNDKAGTARPPLATLWTAGAYVISGGTTPGASLSLSSINFGNCTVLTTCGLTPTTVTLTSTGTSTLNYSSIAKTGADAAFYNLAAGSCVLAGGTLAPSATCTFTVSFSPLTAINYGSAAITVISDAPTTPNNVTLNGTGVATVVPGGGTGGTVTIKGNAQIVLNGQPAYECNLFPCDVPLVPGPQGTPGLNGLPGSSGVQGVQGVKGDKGDPGQPQALTLSAIKLTTSPWSGWCTSCASPRTAGSSCSSGNQPYVWATHTPRGVLCY